MRSLASSAALVSRQSPMAECQFRVECRVGLVGQVLFGFLLGSRSGDSYLVSPEVHYIGHLDRHRLGQRESWNGESSRVLSDRVLCLPSVVGAPHTGVNFVMVRLSSRSVGVLRPLHP